VVDAGHGGWDMGTVGRQGLLEKDLALEIAQRLGVLLEQRLGLEVIYTRTDDTFVPLGRRAAIANQVGADLFISVHANYSSMSAARGVEPTTPPMAHRLRCWQRRKRSWLGSRAANGRFRAAEQIRCLPEARRQASSSPFTDPSPPRAQASATAA